MSHSRCDVPPRNAVCDANMTVNGTTKTRQRLGHSTKKAQLASEAAVLRAPVPIEVQTRTTSDWFGRFAAWASAWLGSKWAFSCAVAVIVVWAATGFAFHYSDTWQLVINTGTTIVTFLMVFLIQNTQNRDSRTLHLKLDELIKAAHGASNQLLDLDHMTDADLKRLEEEYKRLCEEGRSRAEKIAKAGEKEG